MVQINDAHQNWQNTLLLHTFQAELVSGAGNNSDHGSRLGLIPSSMSAMVDLRGSSAGFSERFFVVVAEKCDEGGVVMHMWQLELSSKSCDDEESAGVSHVSVISSKVGAQSLPLPDNVEVIQCVPAAGHLSSSSIYPACSAPYILVTICSDNTVRFWCSKSSGQGYR